VEDLEITAGFWTDRPVLVTGATGLVGGWLVKRLLRAGASVVCLVRDWAPASVVLADGELRDSISIARGDVRSRSAVERVLGEYEIDTVMHLAAQTIVGVAARNPISTLDTNIRGTWQLLEACRRSPAVKQIVIASSDKAYQDQPDRAYSEETPLAGVNPYDVSKSCADLVAQSYAHTYGMPIAITRCGNFFGGGDLNWSRIVPGTIRSILRGQPPVIRSDGRFIRDYFYVEDGAAAYMLLAEALAGSKVRHGDAFNFSAECPMDVLTLVDRILALMSSDLRPRVLNAASNEIRSQRLNSQKARTMLGWRPLFTMEDALRETIDWYRRYFAAV